MSERRFSTMTPHWLMPHSIPRRREWSRRGVVPHQQISRQSADDPYRAGFDGDVSRHVVNKPSRVNRGSKPFYEYIAYVEVIPGEPLYVIAQLRGATIYEEFYPHPAQTLEDTLVLAAKARIGNQEGFFAVLAGGNLLRMRVGNTGGLLQEVGVEEMPPYDPHKLAVTFRNGLIIVSA